MTCGLHGSPPIGETMRRPTGGLKALALSSTPWRRKSVSFGWPNNWSVEASTASPSSLRYAGQMGSPSRVPERFKKGTTKPATFISRAAPSAATTIVGIPGLPVCLTAAAGCGVIDTLLCAHGIVVNLLPPDAFEEQLGRAGQRW